MSNATDPSNDPGHASTRWRAFPTAESHSCWRAIPDVDRGQGSHCWRAFPANSPTLPISSTDAIEFQALQTGTSSWKL